MPMPKPTDPHELAYWRYYRKLDHIECERRLKESTALSALNAELGSLGAKRVEVPRV